MAVLRATARHVLRGLDIIGPKAMHTHIARCERVEAAKEFDHDAFRYERRGGEYARAHPRLCRGLYMHVFAGALRPPARSVGSGPWAVPS